MLERRPGRAQRTAHTVGRDLEAPERVERDVQRRLAARSVDEDGGPEYGRSGRADGRDRLVDRSARAHDVVDDEHALAGREAEAAAELATTELAALRIDSASPQLPRDLVGEDDPAGRRTRDGRDVPTASPGCDRPGEPLRFPRVLQHLEFLEVPPRVTSRGEHEVSIANGARFAEDPLDLGAGELRHCTYSARMRIHDVTLTLRPDMVTWPGEPGPRIEPLRRIASGDSANVSLVTLGDHTGTHVDPPIHFIEGGDTADTLPLDALVGPCRVVEYEGQAHVSAQWLDRAGIAPDTGRLLFKTRNSARWADPSAPFTRDFSSIDASAAQWCVAHAVKLVGIDYLSIEPQGPEKAGYPVHHTLLRAHVVIVEGLDLRAVKAGDYDLVCGPLKLAGGDGAPARVFLIER